MNELEMKALSELGTYLVRAVGRGVGTLDAGGEWYTVTKASSVVNGAHHEIESLRRQLDNERKAIAIYKAELTGLQSDVRAARDECAHTKALLEDELAKAREKLEESERERIEMGETFRKSIVEQVQRLAEHNKTQMEEMQAKLEEVKRKMGAERVALESDIETVAEQRDRALDALRAMQELVGVLR